MYKLEIKKSDDSPYFIEHFNSQEEADNWIAEEQTRPYWDNSHTHTIIRIGLTDQEIADRSAAETSRQGRKTQRLNQLRTDLDNFDTMTAGQRTQVLKRVLRFLLIQVNRELD